MADELYEILGVDKSADEKTIRKAYRRKSKKVHPDAGGSADEMAALSRALTVLVNPAKRTRYDETGSAEAAAESDNVTQSAINNIAFLLNQYLSADAEVRDYKASMIAHFRAKQREIRQAVMPSRRAIDREARIKARWKRKKKQAGEDFIARAITWQVEQHKRLIDKAEGDIRILDRAIEILETYTYEAGAGGFTTVSLGSTAFINGVNF